MSIAVYREDRTVIDADGNEQKTSVERTANIQRNEEPDYIKLYTRMWCEFNEIPLPYRELFLQLATRMSWCNSTSLPYAQLVNTGQPWRDGIMAALGWRSKAMYQRGLKALCDCNAIRQVGRGVYQINPMYAGKGEWKYNPRLQHGGVEDLVAVFRFSATGKTVDTKIVWADDGEDTEFNRMYRTALGVKPSDKAVLKEQRVSDQDQIPGQMSLADLGVV